MKKLERRYSTVYMRVIYIVTLNGRLKNPTFRAEHV